MSSDKSIPGNSASDADESVISLLEEVAKVDIRKRVTGRTRVTTRTEIIDDEVSADLESHGVEVTHVPVGRDLDPDEPVPTSREEGDTTIIPIFEEILVVEKRLRLVEEVHIRRTTRTEDVRIPVTLRRQVAEVDQVDLTTSKLPTETQ